MKSLQHRILVRVNMSQKDFSNNLQTGKSYNPNHRDRNPVMCECLHDNGILLKGDRLLVHHNFFYEGSPYQMQDDIFSIIINKNIFSRIDRDGNPHSIFGNIMAERIPIVYELERPADSYQMYRNRVKVVSNGEGYCKGDVIFCLEYADYEIIYNWNGQERRIIKVPVSDIVGKMWRKV